MIAAAVLQRQWHWANGARQAMERVIENEGDKGEGEYDMPLVDRILTALWIEGYRVIPRTNGG